ncbi:sugar transferase [Candidatus Venteria ishoeyi]|uniref:sugar phosphate nucleotidyltransferase n=1 Tax=Candidatus Venteria ishoeyi TaxID=1899563 RepID=UPI0025A5B90E|nr:sugar phosphate nucleotidyltransferase [Candidatus Venteria ishoeyi]MDM8546547.1 sugar transferase [Candidatus Venteria ishoeyi]
MQAILIADGLGESLKPLTEQQPLALLPVVSKPLIIHALEVIARAGLKDVLVVIGSEPEAFKQQLGDGQRWGLNLTYALSQGEEKLDTLIPRLALLDTEAYVVLRGDVLQSPVLKQFLQQVSETLLYGSIDGQVAFCFCPQQSISADALACLGKTTPHDAACYTLNDASYNTISNFRHYHQANLDAASGRFIGIDLAGRKLALGLTAGRRTQLAVKSLKQGQAFIGAECKLHPSVELLEDVVVSDHVIVERQAILRHSVILPNTYIGELVEVNQAIVQGNQLIRVDSGTVTHITDSFLLADLDNAVLNTRLADWLHRILGALLLVLSLPLWLAASLLAALKQDPRQPRCYQGNRLAVNELGIQQRQHFLTWEWNLNAPVLRHLPKLWAVVRGDLRLVGVSPLSPEQVGQQNEAWEKVRDQAPVGLLGPTQLDLPQNAPWEEKLLSDAFYTKRRSTRKDLAYLWQGFKCLFHSSSWR